MTISAETTLLTKVDGSAHVEVGSTKILCSVTGPIEAKARQELPTTAALEVIIRPAIGVSNTREKLLEDKLRSILSSIIVRHKYPRQLIQVVIQVLEAGEESQFTVNELNGAINACYLALVDANISLYSSFSSISLAIPALQSDASSFIVNPTNEQLATASSTHVISYSINNAEADKIILGESNGSFTEQQLYLSLDRASIECTEIHKRFRTAILTKVSNDFIWKI